MRRAGKEGEGDKVMGPLFPRLHVNDSTLKAGGGPRAPPRNKMALYEQFSVPSQRFNATGSNAAQAHRPAASYAVSSASAGGQIGGSDRPLFPSFCTSEHINTNSNARGSSATRAESGRLSAQLKSKDTTHAAGSTAECSSQRRDNTTTKNSSGKKATNDDNFTVPSIFFPGGVPPHSGREEGKVQEKPAAPFPTTYNNKSGPATSRSSAKHSNADKGYLLQGTNASEDTRSRDSQSIRDKIQAAKTAATTANLEVGERSSSFKLFSTENDRVSSYRDKLSSIDVSEKQRSRTEGHNQARRRNENNAAAESRNAPRAGNGPPYSTGIECNLSEKGLREAAGEKRKRTSSGHYYDDVQREDSPDSSVESLPGLEISPDDVVGAIGPKHFWKARRAIVNQQRVFAVQVFELHRLIKVQKLIAASPHLLIEGDPCLGNALVTSKKKLAAANAEKQLSSAPKTKDDDDDAMLTLQQAEYSPKDNNTEGNNQDSPSQDDDVVEVQQNNQTDASNGAAASSNPPATAMPAPPPDNNNNNKNWCAAPPPPPNQWLVPVMSLSEGLVYKPYSGPCPPAGSFLAPFYASCAPQSLPSTAAGEFMASPYGIPMPHHQPPQQHMGVVPPMPPMYFPPFSMRVVEQVSSRVAPARPKAQHVEHLSARTSCNMRNEAVSAGGIWRFHSSRDSELQGSSAASSPFDRQQQQQGEARAAPPPPPLPASSGAGNNNDGLPQQPSSAGSKENPAARVIRVVPHTARTASESAARIFQSIQMERQQNDP